MTILSLSEQETQISYDRESDEVEVYTANPTDQRKCERLGFTLVKEIKNSGKVIAWEYVTTKENFRWNKKRDMKMTDEKRDKLRERAMANFHSGKS